MKITTQSRTHGAAAFTLIELLTVIAIIAILAAIILPVLSSAVTRAKKVKAATEISQIRAAIEQYESQYGRMPVSTAVQQSGLTNISYGGVYWNKAGTQWPPSLYYFGASPSANYVPSNSDVIAILMNYTNFPNGSATVNANFQKNPQGTKFLNASVGTDTNSPGVGPDLNYRDPWGNPYIITMDLSEDDKAEDLFYGAPSVSSANQTSGGAGLMGLICQPTTSGGDGKYIYHGNVMVWSMGPDGPVNGARSSFDWTALYNNGANKQHIVSWQQ
jgi:prepilin-type N-terminal cleavage/methylation domain-containing protein